MIEIWNLAIQAALLLVALLAFLVPYLEVQRKKQVEALKAVADELRDQLEMNKKQHDRETLELKQALAAERLDRVEKTARIHARIDEMQKELIGDLRADLSEIKGKLEGFSNIMTIVQQWFVNQNNINPPGKGAGS